MGACGGGKEGASASLDLTAVANAAVVSLASGSRFGSHKIDAGTGVVVVVVVVVLGWGMADAAVSFSFGTPRERVTEGGGEDMAGGTTLLFGSTMRVVVEESGAVVGGGAVGMVGTEEATQVVGPAASPSVCRASVRRERGGTAGFWEWMPSTTF